MTLNEGRLARHRSTAPCEQDGESEQRRRWSRAATLYEARRQLSTSAYEETEADRTVQGLRDHRQSVDGFTRRLSYPRLRPGAHPYARSSEDGPAASGCHYETGHGSLSLGDGRRTTSHSRNTVGENGGELVIRLYDGGGSFGHGGTHHFEMIVVHQRRRASKDRKK